MSKIRNLNLWTKRGTILLAKILDTDDQFRQTVCDSKRYTQKTFRWHTDFTTSMV